MSSRAGGREEGRVRAPLAMARLVGGFAAHAPRNKRKRRQSGTGEGERGRGARAAKHK